MKLSTPPVSPSARPRNSENEPRVTISGGIRPRVIKSPFTLPASAPRTSVSAAAAPIGSPASRQSLPKTTAERPISEPTDRSMPPLVITGVSATASRPISTLRRKHLEGIRQRRGIGADHREDRDLQHQERRQDRLRGLEPQPAGGTGRSRSTGRAGHVTVPPGRAHPRRPPAG